MSLKLNIQGRQTPKGTLRVSGAKNSATRLLAASLLTKESVRLRNFPTRLIDVHAKVSFIRQLGVEVDLDDQQETIEIKPKNVNPSQLTDYKLPIRTTYLLAGGQLVDANLAHIPYPGGCKIGARGYDLHLKVWRALGCTVNERADYIEVKGQLTGGTIDFPISTVGGTENAIICGSVATGITEIHNAYITPEVEDLIELLSQMGAQIERFGSRLRIQGKGDYLRGASFKVMPDRVEALTWIVFGAITGGDLLIEDVPFNSMKVPLLHLQECGLDLFCNSDSVHISPACLKGRQIQPFELACGTHPGVISDMQPFYTLLGMKAQGLSRIVDYRYPERLAYAKELNKFCPGTLSCEPGKITTQGVASLQAAQVNSTDLRGSMALIMAAFCAQDKSSVSGVQLAMRGYNNLLEKLSALGLQYELVQDA